MGVQPGAEIISILPESLAEEVGLEPGDRLLAVNGRPLLDLIDYQYACADEELELVVLKSSGEEWIIELSKDYDEELGLRFATATFDGQKRCRNKCVFCFVDQMPPKQRATLYEKDDDYRLSFLQGNFITLTNLDDNELKRIIELRLSPLYISVHTTNPDLRVKMLGNPAASSIVQQLQQLADAGIQMHTQIVLCPGINDGDQLQRTISDLANLWPAVQSVAIVPVGLTQYRNNLYPLRTLRSDEASDLIDQVQKWQMDYQQKYDKSFVYLSDEIYLLGNREFPSDFSYDDYPQTENGVGLSRLFLDEFEDMAVDLPMEIKPDRHLTIVSGVLGGKVLKPVVDRLRLIKGLAVDLRVVENHFFGPAVTVTGLITGQDILEHFRQHPPNPNSKIIIPNVMLKYGETVFIDNQRIEDLSDKLGIKIEAIDNTAGGLIEVILEK